MTHIFRYPKEFQTLPAYTAHRDSAVKIIRPLKDGVEYDKEDGAEMFLIEAADGWRGHAYTDELDEIKTPL